MMMSPVPPMLVAAPRMTADRFAVAVVPVPLLKVTVGRAGVAAAGIRDGDAADDEVGRRCRCRWDSCLRCVTVPPLKAIVGALV